MHFFPLVEIFIFLFFVFWLEQLVFLVPALLSFPFFPQKGEEIKKKKNNPQNFGEVGQKGFSYQGIPIPLGLHFKTAEGKHHPWTRDTVQENQPQGIGFCMTNWSSAQDCIAGAAWDRRVAALFLRGRRHFLACLDFQVDKTIKWN